MSDFVASGPALVSADREKDTITVDGREYSRSDARQLAAEIAEAVSYLEIMEIHEKIRMGLV